MARLINLFAFTGTVGNVVGFCRNGKYFIRSKPVRRSKRTTPAQMIHRAKFAKVTKLVTSLSPLLTYSIPNPKKMTRSNYVTAHIMKHATYGNYPDIMIDYSQVPVSYGELQQVFLADAVSSAGSLIYTWDKGIYSSEAHSTDKVILIAYCEALNQCIFSTNTTIRSTGIASLSVYPFKGHEVQTWLAFKSEDGKLTSKSTYTGSLFVT